MKTPDITDIPIGRENAISREALCNIWCCCDRVARKNIQALRMEMPEDGYIIVSSSHDTGYYRTNDPAEIAAFIKETEARARHTFMPLQVARVVLANVGQVRMEV